MRIHDVRDFAADCLLLIWGAFLTATAWVNLTTGFTCRFSGAQPSSPRLAVAGVYLFKCHDETARSDRSALDHNGPFQLRRKRCRGLV